MVPSTLSHATFPLLFSPPTSYSTRMMKIQTEMAERAIQLLALPEGRPAYIVDVGTGSGLSGEVLSANGFEWVGVDISASMLGIALEREVEGDLVLADMGQGLTFRAGTFDGCISISALQWLCNADQSDHNPKKRLDRFFTSLYRVLVKGARAVFQFYPENAQQIEMINRSAMRAGFTGGVVVDYPNSTKAKKFFLCLFAGETGSVPSLPQALGVGLMGEPDSDYDGDDDDADGEGERKTIEVCKPTGRARHQRRSAGESHKQWIARKKERQRKQGKHVVSDSKYSGRSRGPKF